MTTMELKAMKMELVQTIVDEINTEEMLREAKVLFDFLINDNNHPHCYTVEEMRDSLEETFEQYENNKLIPHNQIKRL